MWFAPKEHAVLPMSAARLPFPEKYGVTNRLKSHTAEGNDGRTIQKNTKKRLYFQGKYMQATKRDA